MLTTDAGGLPDTAADHRLSAFQLSLGLCGQAASLICAARLFTLASLDSSAKSSSGFYVAAVTGSLLGLVFSGIYTGAGVAAVVARKLRLLTRRNRSLRDLQRLRQRRRQNRALLNLVLLNGMALPCAFVQVALSLPALLSGLVTHSNAPKALASIGVGFAVNLAYCACIATLACRQLCAAFRGVSVLEGDDKGEGEGEARPLVMEQLLKASDEVSVSAAASATL